MLTVGTTVLARNLKKLIPASSIVASVRENSDITFLKQQNPANFKSGPGGRSSFSGRVVTIFGAASYLGLQVSSHIAKTGTQIVVPYRDMFYTKRLKVMGDLGQIIYTEFSLQEEDTIRKAMLYSDTVINLIGRHHNQCKNMFEKVNVTGARKIARIAKEMGISQYIHVSALNCNVEQKGYWNKTGSEFLRSKYRGEMAVKEEFPEATILRPSDIFGHNDIFLTSLCHQFRAISHNIGLPNAGVGIYKQPVYSMDVAQGITNIVMNPEVTKGITYEATGPRRYELCDLMEYLNHIMHRDDIRGCKIFDLKYSYFTRVKYYINLYYPMKVFPKGPFNPETIEREAISDTTSGLPTLNDLNVQLTPIEEQAPDIIRIFRVKRDQSQNWLDDHGWPELKYESSVL